MQHDSSWELRRVIYNRCCSAGRIHLPNFIEPPPELSNLMRFNGGHESREFMHHIRQYNCLFNFYKFYGGWRFYEPSKRVNLAVEN
jgi:hypothetical protein